MRSREKQKTFFLRFQSHKYFHHCRLFGFMVKKQMDKNTGTMSESLIMRVKKNSCGTARHKVEKEALIFI